MEQNRKLSSKVSEPCGKIAENFRNGSEQNGHGVGVGVGIGGGVTCKVLREKSSPRKTRRTPETDESVKSRHERIHQAIMDWYIRWAGMECPWGVGEGSQLKAMLDAWPKASDLQLLACLENIASSDCLPRGDRPQAWLSKLPKFVNGPLDEFWKPKAKGRGPCTEHPNSGKTATGGCWGCYTEKEAKIG